MALLSIKGEMVGYSQKKRLWAKFGQLREKMWPYCKNKGMVWKMSSVQNVMDLEAGIIKRINWLWLNCARSAKVKSQVNQWKVLIQLTGDSILK